MKKADLGIAAYLLCAVIFFIIPIPSILLDVMLMVNISIALIILFNACLLYTSQRWRANVWKLLGCPVSFYYHWRIVSRCYDVKSDAGLHQWIEGF